MKEPKINLSLQLLLNEQLRTLSTEMIVYAIQMLEKELKRRENESS